MLGVLIPPSVVLVVYAIIAEQGVPQLFAAALFPGLICAVLHIVVIAGDRLSPAAPAADEPVAAARRAAARALALWKIADPVRRSPSAASIPAS